MGRENLVGQKFGKLTVVEMLYHYNGTKTTKCRCVCDCGMENVIRTAYQLKQAKASSCGCGRKEYIRKSHGKEIDGQKFGRLTVLETLWDETPVKVRCICECGNIGIYSKRDVMSGHTKSCGCLQSEMTGLSNMADHTNEISDYGVKILRQARKNGKGQWLWDCECGYCGNTFQELPARVLNNHVRSCGCVKHSSIEAFIKSYLISIQADFKTEYVFDDFRMPNNYPLRFDFAIFNNGILKCLIEYDGQQHFHPVSIFGGVQGFLATKARDKMKDEYCKNHEIVLYRIPYFKTETEIKEILNDIVYP